MEGLERQAAATAALSSGSDDKLVGGGGVKFGDAGTRPAARPARVPFPPPRPSRHAPRTGLVDGVARGGRRQRRRRTQGYGGKLVGGGGIKFRGGARRSGAEAEI
jgi:hypothetical protein